MAFDFHPFLCDPNEKAMIAKRLEGLEAKAVYEICTDTTEPLNTRFFGSLRLSREDQTKLIDRLMLDDTDVLWTQLYQFFLPTDSPKLRAVLRRHWDESTRGFKRASLHILAKFGDESVLGICKNLLTCTPKLNGVLAVASLRLLGTEDAWGVLRHYWLDKDNPLDTRVRAADALLRNGEVEPLTFLIETAKQDQSETAYHSVISIYHHHDKIMGLQLMCDILNTTSHGAQDITLRHVASLMGDQSIREQHDGLNLARDWLATQIRSR